MAKQVCCYYAIVPAVISIISCTSNADYSRNNSVKDTSGIIQVVLADNQLESEVRGAFGDQRLKLFTSPFIKTEKPFMFAGKPVEIIQAKGGTEYGELHEQSRGHPYASVSDVKFFPPDSAMVELIFHAGNGVKLFYLTYSERKWIIQNRRNRKL